MLLKYNLDICLDTALNATVKSSATKMGMFAPKANCPTPNTQELLACCHREYRSNSDIDWMTLQREPDN